MTSWCGSALAGISGMRDQPRLAGLGRPMTVNTTRTNGRSSPRKTCAHPGNEQGFSLLEMMVTIALILVVTGISFMSLQPVLRQKHVTTAYNGTLPTIRR